MSTTNDTAQLVPFQYEGSAVRTVLIDSEPWFVVSDAAKILGYRDAANAARLLRSHQQGYSEVSTPSGTQRMLVCNEGGVNRLIMRSNAKNAEDIQDWFTDVVLPEIRKTGTYNAAPALTEDEIVHQALQIQSRKVKELESAVADMAPKVDAYDRFIDTDGTYSVGSTAKMLGRSQNKLFSDLRNSGILISKGAMRNTPYQRYMHHFAVKAFDFERSDGSHGTSYSTRVQPSGVAFIARKLGLAAVLELEASA